MSFLGMTIEIVDKKIHVSMKDKLLEAIESFGESVGRAVTSPANKNLFVEAPGPGDEVELDAKKSDIFHSVVAKVLYIMKRARNDLETAVAYLCTRVSKSNVGDWKKLKRVLAFVKATIDDVRVIGASSLSELSRG